MALLRRVHDDPGAALGTAVDETYRSTLMQFHGFFVSSAFTVGGDGVCIRCACRVWLCAQAHAVE